MLVGFGQAPPSCEPAQLQGSRRLGIVIGLAGALVILGLFGQLRFLPPLSTSAGSWKPNRSGSFKQAFRVGTRPDVRHAANAFGIRQARAMARYAAERRGARYGFVMLDDPYETHVVGVWDLESRRFLKGVEARRAAADVEAGRA